MTHQQAIDKHAAERYLLDEMPELERFAFEEHYFACQTCAEDVRTGALMQEGVKGGLLPEVKAEDRRQKAEGTRQKAEDEAAGPAAVAPVAAVSRKPQAASRVLPWAVAATLALAAGYQTLAVIPGLRSQVVGPSVLSPVTLRSATRGAAPSLTRPTTGALSFAVDLAGVASGGRLTYDLRAADGRSVASGTAAAPPPGTPLLLLIPASALDVTGSYTLSVVPGDGPGSAAVEYAFTITNP